MLLLYIGVLILVHMRKITVWTFSILCMTHNPIYSCSHLMILTLKLNVLSVSLCEVQPNCWLSYLDATQDLFNSCMCYLYI